MAEWAQEKLEEVWVAVGEHLRLPPSLISSEECHALLQRVRQLEHSLVSTVKHKSHYVCFISYISQLLELIKQRRDQYQFTHRKAEIEGVIKTRALAILSSANFRFPNDLQLWMTCINFCIKNKRLIHVSKVLVQMLHYLGHEPHLWIFAARTELDVMQAIETARALMLQGLKRHPDSLLLNKEYFKFELVIAERLRDRDATVEELLNDAEFEKEDDQECTKIAEVVFENIKATKPFHFELILSCWQVCLAFKFAKGLATKIENYLREKFDKKEEFWQAKLSQALKSGTLEELKQLCAEALESCSGSASIHGLLMGPILRKISTLTSRQIAMPYFAHVLDLFCAGLKFDSVDEKTCENFFKVLILQDPKKAEELIKFYIGKYPNCVGANVLYLEVLGLSSSVQSREEMKRLMLTNTVLVNSSDFWCLIIEKLPSVANSDENFESIMSKLLTSATVSCPVCKVAIKTVCVKLVELNEHEEQPNKKWRKLQRVLSLPPLNYELLKTILNSFTWLNTSHKKWLFEHFSRWIGKDCIQVWMDYKAFFLSVGDVNQANLCNDRALRQLSNELVPQFLEKVSMDDVS